MEKIRDKIIKVNFTASGRRINIIGWKDGRISIIRPGIPEEFAVAMETRLHPENQILRIDLSVREAKELGRHLIELATESSDQPAPVQTGEGIE